MYEFTLEYKKLAVILKEKKMSEAQLSRAIGKSEKWLGGVKKRLDENKETTIKLTDANFIASCLNCTIQDLGRSIFYAPIIFDYRRRAEKSLSAVPDEDIEWVSFLLDNISVFSDEKKRVVRVLGDRIKSIPEGSYNIYGSLWWACVYFKELRNAVLQSDCTLHNCSGEKIREVHIRTEDEFKRIYQQFAEGNKLSKAQIKDKISQTIMHSGGNILDLVLSRPDLQEKACERCADYLIGAFTYMEPKMANEITLYKEGVL